jgi:hypothetical protein
MLAKEDSFACDMKNALRASGSTTPVKLCRIKMNKSSTQYMTPAVHLAGEV